MQRDTRGSKEDRYRQNYPAPIFKLTHFFEDLGRVRHGCYGVLSMGGPRLESPVPWKWIAVGCLCECGAVELKL